MMCTDVLILAGGSGERLWPVSDARKPKQFMALQDGESFLQSAVRRAFALGIEGDICIVTRRDWTGLVLEDIRSLAERMHEPSLPGRIIVMSEPCGKNTAPPIAWTARYLLTQKRSKAVNMLLMASDHIIKPLDSFIADVQTASWHAERDALVSFAIATAYPATGYGYIRTGEAVPCPLPGAGSAFRTESFKEKPDAGTALAYLGDGRYFWNSGIYAFRADFYLSELARHCPGVASAFESIGPDFTIESSGGIRVMTACGGLEDAYRKSPSISIDYAISEKCRQSVTVRASFLWDDVGTWDSLAKYFEGLPENACPVQSENCFVLSDVPVALCGVNDLVVVIRNGKALIARKGETNLVKDALALMKEKGLE
jgi:Mannose-1-phosphate guanylyltransferase